MKVKGEGVYTQEVEEHMKAEEDRYSYQDRIEDSFDEKPMKKKMLLKVKKLT